jgi:hypothetical protein
MANLIDELKNAIVELEADKVVSSVKAGLDEGLNPLSLVKSLQAGMVEIGDRFAKGEYYLSELIMSGEIMKNAMALIEPKLAGGDRYSFKTFLMGASKPETPGVSVRVFSSSIVSSFINKTSRKSKYQVEVSSGIIFLLLTPFYPSERGAFPGGCHEYARYDSKATVTI